jgi:hypothetical protein
MHTRPSALPAVVLAIATTFLLAVPPALAQQQQPASRPTPLAPAGQKPAPQPPKQLTPAEIEEQQKLAITSYEAGEYLKFVQATMRLRNARPYEPQYMIGMVVGGALVNRPKTSYTYMHMMQQQGLSYDFNTTDDTESIRGTEVYDYLNKLLVKAAEPTGVGETAFELPKSAAYPEALAWDAGSSRFLVGTLEGGKVLAISPEGKVTELLESGKDNGLRAIHGLAVDAERKRLWVSTTATPAFGDLEEGELGRTALLEFDLDSLELLNRFEPPADQYPHFLGSIGLTPGGDVFVMDRAVPMVFIKPQAGNSLSLFMGNFQLSGLRDMTISDDGNWLFLADAALGIMVVDLNKNAANMLAGPESLNLGGISGLDFARGSLYMLQSGIKPQRLMRLDLDATGMNVVNVVPLASGLQSYAEPSFGRVQGAEVFYFAGSNLSGMGDGKFTPLVLRTPVEPSEDQQTPEQRLGEEMLKQGKQP